MFTGIVEEVGTVRAARSGALSIAAQRVLAGTNVGDSIATNGVCLTVTSLDPRGFTADVMPETMRMSNLGALHQGSSVNLERALAANGRFGGHIVTGHIDGTGQIVSLKREGNAVWIDVSCNPDVRSLIVPKGSIAVDGVSLTVARTSDDGFSLSLIPHTGQETALLRKRPGDTVNLENDVVGKYVRSFLEQGFPEQSGRALPRTASGGSRITEDFLFHAGFVN